MFRPCPSRFAGGIALFFVASVALAGCEPALRYQLLTLVFDDVPPPGYVPPPRKPVRTPRAGVWTPAAPPEPEEETEEPDIPPEPVRPAIESASDWTAAVAMLPRHMTGGPDWAKALGDGVIEPRAAIDPLVAAPAAFPLNIAMNEGEPFAVTYPHAPHSIWLQCTNCHPEVFLPKRGANDFEMADIFEGRACGVCHGKVAFAPESNCIRCHDNLRAPPSSGVAEEELARAATNPLRATTALLARGKKAYGAYCSHCHGDSGDGLGPAAPDLDPQARDFRQGTYKFRSTPAHSLPSDHDIFRTITMGAPGTSMPAFAALPYEEKWALVHYIKSFSDRFDRETPLESIAIPPRPPMFPELLEAGRQAYAKGGCAVCHGEHGGGDGAAGATLKDSWGFPVRPFNFASGEPIRSGAAPEDIYRAFMTGIAGSPMPAFEAAFTPDQAWALVYYLQSLAPVVGPVQPAAIDIVMAVRELPPPPPAAPPVSGARPDLPVYGNIYFPARAEVPEIAPATFPHWKHRIRFRCLTCHPDIFPMSRDATGIDMAAISAGEFCGRCHDHNTAWGPTFDTCVKCHPAHEGT